ncbi:phosphatase PAP2 family protein [Robertkochia solimangrovi]|uniref:phosphatase PAP2 family protein n=1 Tax=Robertkochia solimangrovi TaxID=2213046 RepID=UPI001F55573C|nr:phosphatase PAP2 family protein [Robertkochia solimangrovi]
MNKRTITLVLMLVLTGLSYGQLDKYKRITPDATRWQMLTYDAENIFKGILFSYSRPFHWEQQQWLTFGGVAAGAGILYTFDEHSREFFLNHAEDVPEVIKNYGWYYGSPQNNFMLTGAVYITGLALKNEKLRRTGVLLITSASAAGFLQQLSKTAFGRARPSSGKDKNDFYPFSSYAGYHSFPSGHTVLAFTNAYAIAKQFSNPWVKAGIYTIGLVPGVSRLWADAHWLTDVALGVALSIATVEAVDKYLDSKYEEKYNDRRNQVSWNFKAGPGTIGVALIF